MTVTVIITFGIDQLQAFISNKLLVIMEGAAVGLTRLIVAVILNILDPRCIINRDAFILFVGIIYMASIIHDEVATGINTAIFIAIAIITLTGNDHEGLAAHLKGINAIREGQAVNIVVT